MSPWMGLTPTAGPAQPRESPHSSPRRSPQLLATAARNRSMCVLRFVSGSHITCDSMISGSRDMAAAAGRGEHGPSRRHSPHRFNPHRFNPHRSHRAPAPTAAPPPCAPFKGGAGRITPSLHNLPPRRKVRARPARPGAVGTPETGGGVEGTARAARGHPGER